MIDYGLVLNCYQQSYQAIIQLLSHLFPLYGRPYQLSLKLNRFNNLMPRLIWLELCPRGRQYESYSPHKLLQHSMRSSLSQLQHSFHLKDKQ
jgi:hypothetical protein